MIQIPVWTLIVGKSVGLVQGGTEKKETKETNQDLAFYIH